MIKYGYGLFPYFGFPERKLTIMPTADIRVIGCHLFFCYNLRQVPDFRQIAALVYFAEGKSKANILSSPASLKYVCPCELAENFPLPIAYIIYFQALHKVLPLVF
jgi:hypothetical protein